jgi:hypothetical protein
MLMRSPVLEELGENRGYGVVFRLDLGYLPFDRLRG